MDLHQEVTKKQLTPASTKPPSRNLGRTRIEFDAGCRLRAINNNANFEGIELPPSFPPFPDAALNERPRQRRRERVLPQRRWNPRHKFAAWFDVFEIMKSTNFHNLRWTVVGRLKYRMALVVAYLVSKSNILPRRSAKSAQFNPIQPVKQFQQVQRKFSKFQPIHPIPA